MLEEVGGRGVEDGAEVGVGPQGDGWAHHGGPTTPASTHTLSVFALPKPVPP